jgi:polynucleotide 5'-hydroxyl-kinase GRC3/NOL9
VLAQYFIGETTPKHNPQLYIESIRALIDLTLRQRRLALNEPVIVNTHGWVSGLGLQVVETLLESLKPTLTLNMRSENHQELNTLLDTYCDSSNSSSEDDPQTAHTQLVNMQPIKVDEIAFALKHSNAHRRALSLMRYFANCIGPQAPLARPIMVPFARTSVRFVSDEISASQMMFALNCSLVAIVPNNGATNQRRDASADYPPLLKQTPLMPCVSLALIHSVDMQRKLFYVYAPDATTMTSSADVAIKLPPSLTILRGSLELPPLLLNVFAGIGVRRTVEDDDVPYLSGGLAQMSKTIGSQALKVRTNLKRKSHER